MPNGKGIYILMPERLADDNNTIGLMCLFRLLELDELFPNLRLTPRRATHISAAPKVNGADGNAPKETGRRAKNPVWKRRSSLRSRPPGRVFYASSVRKGIRRRRRTSALTFGLAADVFVVASSKLGRKAGQSNLVTGSQSFLSSSEGLEAR